MGKPCIFNPLAPSCPNPKTYNDVTWSCFVDVPVYNLFACMVLTTSRAVSAVPVMLMEACT